MHQLKPFKQNIYPKNEQLDGLNYTFDSNNTFLMTCRTCKVCVETQNLLSDPDVHFIPSCHGKVIKNTLLTPHISITPSDCSTFQKTSCLNGFNWHMIAIWWLHLVMLMAQYVQCISIYTSYTKLNWVIFDIWWCILNILTSQIQIVRFIIKDYDHNMYLFWYGLEQMFMHAQKPSDLRFICKLP